MNLSTLRSEIWNALDDQYQVSSQGRVWSGKTNKFLRASKDGKGYLMVWLYDGHGIRRMKKVHSLVLEAFVGPRPTKFQCNHKDANKNNNRLDNLEWVDQSTNIQHSMSLGLRDSLCRPVVEMTKNGEVVEVFKSIRGAARAKGTTYRSIKRALEGIRYTYRKHIWRYVNDLGSAS